MSRLFEYRPTGSNVLTFGVQLSEYSGIHRVAVTYKQISKILMFQSLCGKGCYFTKARWQPAETVCMLCGMRKK
jgi:hypothetical protein